MEDKFILEVWTCSRISCTSMKHFEKCGSISISNNADQWAFLFLDFQKFLQLSVLWIVENWLKFITVHSLYLRCEVVLLNFLRRGTVPIMFKTFLFTLNICSYSATFSAIYISEVLFLMSPYYMVSITHMKELEIMKFRNINKNSADGTFGLIKDVIKNSWYYPPPKWSLLVFVNECFTFEF